MNTIELSPNEKFSEYIDIIIRRQLLDRSLWKKCVDVFSSGIDNDDAGWRGEYWGKMMRGACLVYSVMPSDELLSVLSEAVEGLLSKQEKSGRISTYREDEEFFGWDMWSRKYVMTGLQHFYDICPDEKLKSRIIKALSAHADYIVERIGKDKINILETGKFWGGVNSASILEPFVRLYKDTKDSKYLEFSEYIISTGGCRDGNLIDCALRNVPAYCYPEQKAYETMSFFEGLLAYYEVTGEKQYLKAVCNFVNSVLETDVTAIGSCGCTHELFDNSSIRQTEASEKIMQETCVTVTLIRLLSRLFFVTDNKQLTDTIRLASLNALSGALNINGYEQYCREKKTKLKGMLFDSYSPLCNSKRGLGIGGFKEFADGSYFGCCACIASAGFALYPIMSISRYHSGISINYLLNGKFSFTTPGGNEAELCVENEKITVHLPQSEHFSIRISNGDDYVLIASSSAGKTAKKENGFTVFEGIWNDSDEIVISVKNKLSEKRLNGKSSFNYGGFALAFDSDKNEFSPDEKRIDFLRDKNRDIVYSICEPQDNEQVRLIAETTSGSIVLCDYASAGQNGKSIVSVWF